MGAGHDLLRTHLLPDRARALASGSDWAPALVTTAVARALLAQTAQWSRQAARHGAQLARASMPVSAAMAERLRGLRAACKLLEAAASAVQAAQRLEPGRGDDMELLRAVPTAVLEPRRLPGGAETIAGLCDGSARAAERVRRAARLAVPEAAWSPFLTAESMSRAATYATVISHHCEIIQHALAIRAAEQGQEELSAALAASASAAGQARQAWLAAARGWRQVKADADGAIPPVPLAPAAAEAGDLALWTGRLAYADPAWTLNLGPSRATRAPADLAPEPADLAGALAAVHQATMTVTVLGAAGRAQVQAAGRAGRLFAPVSSLPEYHNIRRRFVRAPASHVEPLLAAYRDAQAASAQATREASAIAVAIGAPSKIMAMARAAIDADNPAHLREAARRAAEPGDGADPAGGRPGPVERQLRHLGVTSPALLTRGKVLDHAGERLMLDVAQDPSSHRPADPHARADGPRAAEPAGHALPRASRPRPARRPAERVMAAGGAGRDREPEAPEAEP